MTSDYEWMKHSVGISFHWTSGSHTINGGNITYREAVNGFDVGRFITDLKTAGVGHCILTLTHAEQYLAYPCQTLEKLLPGRTTERDLLGEIMDACAEAGIRFIAYYNHSCNGNDDIVWKKACGYDAGVSGNLDLFADNICNIVAETAQRYGDKLAGWWFDSAYSVDRRGPVNTVSCDMGDWQFPWDKFISAAKSGSSHCAVTVNAGVGSYYLYSDKTDYYSGESTRIDEPFSGEKNPVLIDHRWMCIDNAGWVFTAGGGEKYGFCAPRYSDEQILAYVRENLSAGRMTTFNAEISKEGIINPSAIAQLHRVNTKIASA